jgi:tripartite-type tricarboxylate transporter receptor subunit TctC
MNFVLVLVGFSVLLGASDACAQAYPSRALRIVVAYTPGGANHLACELFNAMAGA